MENALIIFVENEENRKAQDALVNDIGEEKSRQVHRYLLQQTRDTCLGCNCSHFVFYSSFVHIGDVFDDALFTKLVQHGDNVSEKMMNAFRKVFEFGCKKACLVGTNCYELETGVLEEAFKKLKTDDVVIGETPDHDMYLLGLKRLHPGSFTNSHTDLLKANDMLGTFEKLGLRFSKLPQLNIVTTTEDLLQTNILTHIKEGDLER
jgi:glycosyltransferase A (GT-A) superfamily protein (DUF2064 family)